MSGPSDERDEVGGADPAEPARDGAAWDGPETRAFAARLGARAVALRGGDGELAPPWSRVRTPGDVAARRGEAVAAGVEAVTRRARPPALRARFPKAVRDGLQDCQKPFHLWNVERIEDDAPFRLRALDPYRLGAAAETPDELRPPRTIAKASRELKAWLEDQAFRALLQRRAREETRRAWREPLPFGRPDEQANDQGTPAPAPAGPPPASPLPPGVRRIAPPGPSWADPPAAAGPPPASPLPPGVRRIAPPGPSWADPPPAAGPPPASPLPPGVRRIAPPGPSWASPPAGFDLSQPDDEDDDA